MIRLLVTSIINMTEEQLQAYANNKEKDIKNMTAEKFMQILQAGNEINVDYGNGVNTSYSIIREVL